MALKSVSESLKSREDNPFVGPLVKRDIVVAAGAQWPTGSGCDYVIPLGVPMAPYSGGNGQYRPIRRSYFVTAVASADTQLYVEDADGFATGDVIGAFTSPDSTTTDFTATLTAVDYTNNILGIAALGTHTEATAAVTNVYVEVVENGYIADPKDAVFLGENIQTKDALSGTTYEVPAVGIIKGQVDINRLAANCYDTLMETQLPGFDYIPTTPGV